jgi:hypothetical protein
MVFQKPLGQFRVSSWLWLTRRVLFTGELSLD